MPRTRPAVVEGLDVNEGDEGLIVYDPTVERVHYLNSTAAIVFTLCDGRHKVAEIAGFVAEAFGFDSVPMADVEAWLKSLDNEGLLQ